MLHKTNGIVLRAVKYGDTSLVTTIFTAQYGVQTYMVQGVRSAKQRQNRAGCFQPGILLELVVYHHPEKNLQRISQFQVAYIYSGLQEDVVKNSIVLFSTELLLRLLPEQGPLPGLFDFAYSYFINLDKMPLACVANFPLFFIIQCGRELGFDLKGSYSKQTPYLDVQEGGFTEHKPLATPAISEKDANALSVLLCVNDYDALQQVQLNAAIRLRLIDWYVDFLQLHTQHMDSIKSLAVLRVILH